MNRTRAAASRSPMRLALTLFILVVLAVAGNPARAHSSSLAYLAIDGPDAKGHLRVDWDIALRDLDWQLDLDRDRDGALRWAELRPRLGEAVAAVAGALQWRAGSAACQQSAGEPTLIGRSDGSYLRLPLAVRCPAGAAPVQAHYTLFEDLLPGHRALVTHDGGVQSWLSGDQAWHPLGADARTGFASFIVSGIEHILVGWDHLAFLAALLLAATLLRRQPERHHQARSIAFEIVSTLTAFTLAHSLTLGLAVTGFIRLPPGPVEAAIAASIVVAALLNLRRGHRGRPALLAFGFGLVHGLGFASVLAGAHGELASVVTGLLGFNLGVEIGQLAFAALLLPPLLLLMNRPPLARVVGSVASIGLVGLGSMWLVERLIPMTTG